MMEDMKDKNLSLRLVLVFALGILSALCLAKGASASNMINIRTGTFDDDNIAAVNLEIEAEKDVQAFVIAFEWENANVQGTDLIPNDGAGKPLAGADLVVKRVEAQFMVFSVVMDVDGQDAEVIPKGAGIVVGTAKFRCEAADCGATLDLVDKKYATVEGGPVLSNILVLEGKSIGVEDGLVLDNGAVSKEVQPAEVTFACGGSLDGDGKPGTPSGSRGTIHTVTFYYKSPGDGAGNTNKIQGLSMALWFDNDLTAIEDSFDIEGGALKQVDAEFIHLEVDNIDKNDPCQLALGVLVDAVAPYDGRTLPSSSNYKKVFSIDFEINSDSSCGHCQEIQFRDGISVNGLVDVYNVATINFMSQTPKLVNCEVCVEPSHDKFFRGDCNMSMNGKRAVDISDAVTMVAYFFLDAKPSVVTCLDACDANDDGKLDAADVAFVLNYLFVPYSPKPPAPGPTSAGVDKTSDTLDCEGGIESDC
jgi:hypothetical protein